MSECKINLNDLKCAILFQLDALIKLGFEEIQINHDMAWSISRNDMYNLSSDPTSFEVTSLIDTIYFLNEHMKEKGFAPYFLVELSILLDYVGFKSIDLNFSDDGMMNA